MQIGSVTNTLTAIQVDKSGNNFPPTKVEQSQSTQKEPTIRDLAKSIDPSSMNRNDALAIAAALFPDEPSAAFAAQGLVLVNENGHLHTAVESDPIMNEKFDMFDSLKSQIEFNKSKGFATASLEKGLEFLEKLKLAGEKPAINLYT